MMRALLFGVYIRGGFHRSLLAKGADDGGPILLGSAWFCMGISISRGAQIRPKYIMILITGTTKIGPLIWATALEP